MGIGHPAPLTKKGAEPPTIFGPCLLWQNGSMYQDATWYGHIVLGGDPAPQKGGHSPQFSAHDYCGQTAGWIKMPLGMVVRLGPGHTVLDGDPSSNFSAHMLWPNRWMDQDATW